MPQPTLLERRSTTVFCSVLGLFLAACLVCGVSSGRSGPSLGCNVREFLQHQAKKPGCRTQNIVLNACFGRCDTYQVPILEPPYKTSNHDMCSYDDMELKSIELRDCDYGVNRTYVYINAKSCRCRQCSTYDTHCLGVH